MEVMGSIENITKELKQLNRNTKIRLEKSGDSKIIIARCKDCSQLDFPVGYYYISGEVTNAVNNNYGPYETFEIMTEYDYLVKLA